MESHPLLIYFLNNSFKTCKKEKPLIEIPGSNYRTKGTACGGEKTVLTKSTIIALINF